MQGRKPNDLTVLKRVRPGGGRLKHSHVLQPMLGAPEHLDVEEKEVFESIRLSAPSGLLAQIDRFLVEAFAQHTVLHRRALREMDALTFESESTRRAHPLVAIANVQAKILLSLSEALGLTATGRQRIKLPNLPSDDWSTIGPA
jgi:phage terminase small subunit